MRAFIALTALFLTPLQQFGIHDRKHISLGRLLRCVVVSLGVVTGQALGLSQPISAVECIPQDQPTEESRYLRRLESETGCMKSIERRGVYSLAEMADGTLVIYGDDAGPKNSKTALTPTATQEYTRTPQYSDSDYLPKLRDKLDKSEFANALTITLIDRLYELKDNNYDYSTTDGLFAELLGIVKNADWTQSYPLPMNVIETFGKHLPDYGRRYSELVVKTLFELFAKYPTNENLADQLRNAVNYTLKSEKAPPKELPTAEERRALGETLFEFMKAYPAKLYLYRDGEIILKLIDPELAEQIMELEKTQR